MTPICRLCKSTKTSQSFISQNYHGRHLLSNHNFTVYYCQNCQAYFIDKVENSKDYRQNFYQRDYYAHQTKLSNILQTISHKLKTNIIQNKFKDYRKINLLDIGCGRGEFLDQLPKKFIKTGIDINLNLNLNLKKNSQNIIINDFNKHNFSNKKFDCITMWQVYEHLANPNLSLKKIFKLLKPGGILIFDTPNSNSLGFFYGKKYFFHLDSPRHLFIPNPKNIKLLLKTAGFINIKINKNYLDYPQDLYWSVRHSLAKLFIYPFYPFFKILSPDIITIYATKPKIRLSKSLK